MANVTIAELCEGVAATLLTATGIKTSLSDAQVKEGFGSADLPLIQVYPEAWELDIESETDRTTFITDNTPDGKGVRQKQFTLHVDLYAAQLSNIGEDLRTMTNAVSAITDVLEAQDTLFFGVEAVQAWRISGSRVNFMSYTGEIKYTGARWILDLRIF